jgi:hypothetical protein
MGILKKLLSELVVTERVRQKREPCASRIAIDSQSVKKVSFISLESGIDGGEEGKRAKAAFGGRLPWVAYSYKCNISTGA